MREYVERSIGVCRRIWYYASMTIKTYTREELTEILQVSLTTVGNLINEKKIFSIKVGKSIRVPEWSLHDFLHGKPAYQPGDPLTEPDYYDLPTDSLFRETESEGESGESEEG